MPYLSHQSILQASNDVSRRAKFTVDFRRYFRARSIMHATRTRIGLNPAEQEGVSTMYCILLLHVEYSYPTNDKQVLDLTMDFIARLLQHRRYSIQVLCLRYGQEWTALLVRGVEYSTCTSSPGLGSGY